MKAARFYYDWILKRLQDRGEAHHYPGDLDDYCRRLGRPTTIFGDGPTLHLKMDLRFHTSPLNELIMDAILLITLIILLVAALPTWPYRSWHNRPRY